MSPGAGPGQLSTGDAGLDRLTQGGLVRRSMQVIVGVAGAGKSILAHQIGARHVRDGGKVLYLTALIESHEMLIAQARTMHFFDPATISHAFYYASLNAAIQRGGFDEVRATIRRLVTEREPTLVIIDGVHALRVASESDVNYQRFLHELESQAVVAGITVLVLTHPREQPTDEPTHTADDPTFTLADGVIALRSERITLRRVRWLSVMKMRGVAHIDGWHSFEITSNGLTVYPRLEALVARGDVAARVPSTKRCDLIVAGLGDVLGGGLPENSATLVFGTSGAGKTLLGLAFLLGNPDDTGPALYLGFHETPDRLMAKAERVGLGLRQAVEQERVVLEWRAPSELLADELAQRVLALVDARGVRRLVIDTVGDLRRGTVVGGRDLDFLSAFLDVMRSKRVTTFMTQDMPRIVGGPLDLPFPEASPIVDNLMCLRLVELRGALEKLLVVIKMRESSFDEAIRELRITSGGLAVGQRFEHAETLLVGQGRIRP